MKTIGNTPITYLTKREYFAAMAMQGILSNAEAYRNHPSPGEYIIRNAIEYADELIKELNTESDEGNEV